MKAQAEVELTAEMVADWFWEQSTTEQADFLEALANRIESETDSRAVTYGFGELQWCHLKEELRQPGRELANQMHMAFSAFAFDFWPQKHDGARNGI